MYFKNCTQEQMQSALDIVNKRYQGNIRFKRLDKNGKRIIATLTVNDSKAAGSRISASYFSGGRRVKAACWHAHGYFFEALLSINPDAIITSAHSKIDRNGGNWRDVNIGSQMYPVYYSEACEC